MVQGLGTGVNQAVEHVAVGCTCRSEGLYTPLILIPNWSAGRPAALDVHVISPLQQQTIREAASTPGHALDVGT